MSRYNTNIPRLQLNDLHLSRGTTRESKELLPKTSQAQWVIGGLKDRQLLWRGGKRKHMDAV
jgi:hypothetical protein